MSEICLEIRKSLVEDQNGGDVAIYFSTHKHIGITEAQRFALVLIELINIEEKWQENAEDEL